MNRRVTVSSPTTWSPLTRSCSQVANLSACQPYSSAARDSLSRGGLAVIALTVNEAPSMQRMVELGVDGMSRNLPELLARVKAKVILESEHGRGWMLAPVPSHGLGGED
jgi:hypothetical protein